MKVIGTFGLGRVRVVKVRTLRRAERVQGRMLTLGARSVEIK